MFSLFGPRQHPVLGIDISGTSVKLVELSRKKGRFRLESYAVEPLPQGAVMEDVLKELETIGEAVKRALKRSRSRLKDAALALPTSAVITKVITMPDALGEDDLETQIQLEADQYIPYPLEEVNLDFEVLGSSANKPDMVDVLLAASRSENVEARVAAVNLAGLNARIMDVESYAMEKAIALLATLLPDQGTGKTIAVMDIGGFSSTLHVIHDFRTIYNREETFGGNQLTDQVMGQYGLPYDDAVRAIRGGTLPADFLEELVPPFRDLMAQQILRGLQFFYSSSEYGRIDHLVVAGGSASLPGVKELVQAKTGTPTTIANPFADMEMVSGINKAALVGDAPALMIACGLAMRSFD